MDNLKKNKDEDFASFENMLNDKDIVLTLEWDTGTGATFTTIKPHEVAEIRFDNHTAIVCHKSDGGSYAICPNQNTVSKARDYFQLEENGTYSN